MVLKIEAQRNKKPQQPIFLPIREVTLQRKDNTVLVRTISTHSTKGNLGFSVVLGIEECP